MVLQLTAKRIDVSMDVPGDKQSLNFSETSAKLQINNVFDPVNGGANNLLITESKNSYNGGFRWKHTTTYSASPGSSPGTFSLFRFVNTGSEVETEIFSIDGTGNIIFDNNVTVNGTFVSPGFSVPSLVSVSGTTQTFQYDGNHNSKFVLKNIYAATIGNPSFVELDFVNSTTGGYKFIHTSSTTDIAGIGTLSLKVMNNVGTTLDILNFGIDGGGVPTIDAYGTLSVHGSNFFNIGGTGQSVFYVSPTIPDPTNPTDAASKQWVESLFGGGTITLSGAVSGSGLISTTISTLLNSNIAVQGASQAFSYSGNHDITFDLINSSAATIGVPSTIKLNFTNSTTAGYRFIHISQSTDPAGLGQFKLQIYNNVGITKDIYNISIDGGGNPIFDYYGTFNSHSSNFFNIGGIGQSVFYVSPTVPDPTNPTDATSKQWVENAIASNSISLTGAITGSGSGSISTTLNPLIAVSGSGQTFEFIGNSSAIFSLQNVLAPSIGVPSYVYLYFINSFGGGYNFKHTIQTTDSGGLGQFSLQTLNSIGIQSDVFTVSRISGNTVFTHNTLTTFNVDTTFNGNAILSTAPTLGNHLTNKTYVDSVAGTITSTPITLTGAVSGIDSISNPIFTTLNTTIPVGNGTGATQAFNFSLNSIATFKIANLLATTVGSPCYVRLDLLNQTTGGYRFLHTSTSTDTAGLGTLKIQAINSFGTTQDLATFSVNSGSGIGDMSVAATANFNNIVSFNGSSAGAAINLSSYAFTLNNTNATGITEYVIGNLIPYLKFGLNNSSGISYIDSVFQPFQIRMAGTTYFTFSSSGNLGIGSTSPTQAKLVISGGVANVSGENSCLRATGNSNATKIELENTSASGKLFEIRSLNNGSLDITDRTSSVTRLSIDTTGVTNIFGGAYITGQKVITPTVSGIYLGQTLSSDFSIEICANSGTAASYIDFTQPTFDYKGRILYNHSNNYFTFYTNQTLCLTLTSSQIVKLPNIAGSNRRLSLYEVADNDFQFIGFGTISSPSGMSINVSATTDNFTFFAGTSSTTRNEVLRILGTGGIQFNNANTSPLTYYADVSITGTWSGFTVASASKTVRTVRVGKKVTIEIQSVSGTVTIPGALGFSASLGTDFRPSGNEEFPIIVLDNGSIRIGILVITSSGIINILTTNNQGTQTSFTNGTCGLGFNVSVSYLVA
jgi:hypothetical protein